MLEQLLKQVPWIFQNKEKNGKLKWKFSLIKWDSKRFIDMKLVYQTFTSKFSLDACVDMVFWTSWCSFVVKIMFWYCPWGVQHDVLMDIYVMKSMLYSGMLPCLPPPSFVLCACEQVLRTPDAMRGTCCHGVCDCSSL